MPLNQRKQRLPSIDVALLDMDGTLLDLNYDDTFWNHFLPEALAQRQGMTSHAASQHVEATLSSMRGTLAWYDIEHWSRIFEIEILALKAEYAGSIEYRPGSMEFLKSLKSRGITTLLATNAHPDLIDLKIAALEAKALPFTEFFNEILSSHQIGEPKESPHYWRAIQEALAFDPNRALFVDDNLDVLRTAQNFGIAHCIAVNQPDLSQPIRDIRDFPSVTRLNEIEVDR